MVCTGTVFKWSWCRWIRVLWKPLYCVTTLTLPNDLCLPINSQIFCALDNFYLPLSQFYNVVHKMISTVSPNSLLAPFMNCKSVNWDLTQRKHISSQPSPISTVLEIHSNYKRHFSFEENEVSNEETAAILFKGIRWNPIKTRFILMMYPVAWQQSHITVRASSGANGQATATLLAELSLRVLMSFLIGTVGIITEPVSTEGPGWE